ncbi:hypothetical protein AVEN_70955-1 [Araneus ventricosus]|uniref:Uncharacterized protein n=1 Tax=Araneus ventricosus TaxID=182803 RepID=A0A4Y2S3U7_ARAVE|nr:hypothetical protein AVEN_70955-1 [Araneus ventricosus]
MLGLNCVVNPLQGLYLDGRKDDALVIDLAHSKRLRRVKKEEHYSLIQEPGSVYNGHVTPTSGISEVIVTFTISYLSGHGISLEKLVVIGCDDTAVNTDISDDEIKSHIQGDSDPNWEITFKTFPVHTQAVERCWKILTEAPGKVCGAKSGDGFIRTTLLSR